MTSNELAIKVENLSKCYRIGVKEKIHDTLLGGVASIVKSPLANLRNLRKLSRFKDDESEDVIWALRDVSFNVKRGEVLGVIGANGAGKSTLLKIISKITHPTSGRLVFKGRVSSLLEVGTGFHPELTGRENVFLNGAVLGMTRREIERKFDEIVAFAEVEKFIDTPVKRYSSGMGVRLAFAVAAHLEPEILLVDEVLAVGDAKFQKKSIGKMKDVTGKGRTVLFVSHNMLAVQNLCDQAILLDEGKLIEKGSADRIVTKYLNISSDSKTERNEDFFDKDSDNSLIRMHKATIHPEGRSPSEPFNIRTAIVMEFQFSTLVEDMLLDININVYNEQNVLAFRGGEYIAHDQKNNILPLKKGRYLCTCTIPGDILNDGMYSVGIFFGKDNRLVISSFDDVLSFEIQDSPERRGGTSHHKLPGVVRPLLKWKTTEI